nr:hypothetical protein [uncultured Acetatifactor sp.]
MAEKIPEHRPEAAEKADLKHIEQMAADLGLGCCGKHAGHSCCGRHHHHTPHQASAEETAAEDRENSLRAM